MVLVVLVSHRDAYACAVCVMKRISVKLGHSRLIACHLEINTHMSHAFSGLLWVTYNFAVPCSIDVIASSDEEDWVAPEIIPEDTRSDDGQKSGKAKLWGLLAAAGGLCTLILGGVVFKDQIASFLTFFTDIVDDLGPAGYVLYFFVYAALEILAVPAIPLTMASGAIFGIGAGSVLVSLSAATAATVSFVIARYLARDKVCRPAWMTFQAFPQLFSTIFHLNSLVLQFLSWAEQNKQFRAVNKVIERDGFKVVTLLRLSPLLPLAASNYLYGLTNVSLPAFFFGSLVGMFPGTVAYVSAGHVGKVAFIDGGDALSLGWWQIGLAFAVTGGAIAYIGSLATAALKEEEQKIEAERAAEKDSQ